MSLAEAVAEWDNVAEIEPAFSSSTKASSAAAPSIPQSSAPVSVEEAIQHFQHPIIEVSKYGANSNEFKSVTLGAGAYN